MHGYQTINLYLYLYLYSGMVIQSIYSCYILKHICAFIFYFVFLMALTVNIFLFFLSVVPAQPYVITTDGYHSDSYYSDKHPR